MSEPSVEPAVQPEIEPPDSAVRQLLALPIGGCYSRSVVIPGHQFNPDRLIDIKRKLGRTVDTAIVRVRRREPSRVYYTHSTHGFTQVLDLIVTVAATREE